MTRLLAAMIAGLIAAGAYAQNPPGTTSQEQMITNSKPQQRAQDKANANPQGNVKKPTGDWAKSPENDSIGTGKAAAAGEAQHRHARREASQQEASAAGRHAGHARRQVRLAESRFVPPDTDRRRASGRSCHARHRIHGSNNSVHNHEAPA